MVQQTLVTGGSGFLGSYIADAWRDSGAVVSIISRCPSKADEKTISCDLAEGVPDLPREFGTVIHCAGMAHLASPNRAEAAQFFRVNVEGTKNLLKAIDALPGLPDKIVLISSVAVYGREEGENIDETFPTLGSTPYARSKIEAEEVVQSWATARGVNYYILRLPLVAGVSPPGNLGRMVREIRRGTYVGVRENAARKSVVRADDVARFTTSLDGPSGIYNLTDGLNPQFCEIENAVAESLVKRINIRIPNGPLKAICRIGDVLSLPINSNLYSKLTSTLTFSSQSAESQLTWRPRSGVAFIAEGGLIRSTSRNAG